MNEWHGLVGIIQRERLREKKRQEGGVKPPQREIAEAFGWRGLAGGGGWGGVYAAVAALALLEVDEGLEETGAIEIGPQDFRDEDFGVGDLPEEEIADTHFAAGANEEIGIRQIRRVEMARDFIFGDQFPVAVAVAFGEDGVHGVDDFGAATIVESDVQNHAGIGGGGFGGFAGVTLNAFGQFFGAAQEAHADVVTLDERQFLAEIFAEELHQELDLGFGSAPVLYGEGIESEGLNFETCASFDGGAGGLRAGAVAGDAREMTLFGPAAVAVHDDGDVAR